MNVAFCVTCKGRTQHLALTLPQNLKDNPLSKVILVDYGDRDGLRQYLQENHKGDMESGQLAVYNLMTEGPFKMAHAKNLAHRLAILEGADILVNMDADNYAGEGFADYVYNFMSDRPDAFMWSRMIKNGDGRLPRGISGRIAVTSSQFLNVGGYDERFDTWSPDDKDFHGRLRRLGYSGAEIDPRFLSAIPHNDKIRFKDYPDANPSVSGDSGEFEAVNLLETTVANFGNFGCGVVFKNMDYDNPQSLGPVPTRIFGIGMHKTATTSLHHALEILGIDSAHWMSAHWAKSIWEEMNTWGRSITLERHYALCDLPITMLYKELDKAYPGSKFILTVREETGWLETVRKHWDPEHNPFRSAWNHDPFSHKCHRILYGRRDFDAQTMLERYRQHNREVLEYFTNRPDDLLVMDMDQGAGWNQLCRFLNKPKPNQKYPRSFSAY